MVVHVFGHEDQLQLGIVNGRLFDLYGLGQLQLKQVFGDERAVGYVEVLNEVDLLSLFNL